MRLLIDRDLPVPVYEQVAAQLRRLIATGALAPGVTLPPVRQLASDLGVNLNTIARCYRLLASEGFLVIRERAGVAVAAPAATVEPAAKAVLLDQLRGSLAKLRQAGMAADELRALLRQEIDTLDVSLGGGTP